ncbi:MAG: hypothetical protein H7196_04900 [candidate division SR1 bacterium]|nr:hypothetical protein [candidate division SR1 bacterium]
MLSYAEQNLRSAFANATSLINTFNLVNKEAINKNAARKLYEEIQEINNNSKEIRDNIEKDRKEYLSTQQLLFQKEAIKGYEDQYEIYEKKNEVEASKWRNAMFITLAILVTFIFFQFFEFEHTPNIWLISDIIKWKNLSEIQNGILRFTTV